MNCGIRVEKNPGFQVRNVYGSPAINSFGDGVYCGLYRPDYTTCTVAKDLRIAHLQEPQGVLMKNLDPKSVLVNVCPSQPSFSASGLMFV
jgi:hypothetical protein